MDRRQLFIGIGLVALVVLLGTGIYFLFFHRTPAEGPPTPPPVNLIPINAPALPPRGNVSPSIPGALLSPPVNAPIAAPLAPGVSPTAQGGRTLVTTLTDSPATNVRLASDGHLQYYDPTSGRFYRIGADGKPVALSDRQFSNVRSVAWSPRDDRAILEFPDGANILYDFRTNQQVTLPKHWEDFSFSAAGDRIAGKSVGVDRENRFLFESAPDGSGFRAIEPLGTNGRKVDVAWSPNNQVVAFSRTGNDIGDGRQQILLIGRNGENFPGLTVEGIDFRPLWSPTGGQVLYSDVSDANDYKPQLWIVGGVGDSIGANRQRLPVETWADKCTFANDTTVYCAVPEHLGRGYGLEPAVADRVPDTIERIDLTTGIRSTVGRPAEDGSISQLQLAPDGSRLFFTSKQDGRLREMRLR